MFWGKEIGIDQYAEGTSIEINGINYRIVDGILRQELVYSPDQSQTKDAFGFKWNLRDTYESDEVQLQAKNWLIERYFSGKTEQLELLLPRGTKVLDAGCGSGFSALFLFKKYLNDIFYLGADISNSVDIAKIRFEKAGCHGEFIQVDLTELPFSEPKFDVIFSEGVLHHTDSTEKAIKYLTTLLVHGGHFLFYVYKKKAPIREFTDDYVRHQLVNMDDSQAWNELQSLTLLGKILGDLNIEVEIPEPISLLEIPAGRINIQRLFYWYICKAFYNPKWKIDEMNHVNFDWYRPLNCHRHTPEEIMTWCNEAGLKIERMNVQEAGITVVAKKE